MMNLMFAIMALSTLVMARHYIPSDFQPNNCEEFISANAAHIGQIWEFRENKYGNKETLYKIGCPNDEWSFDERFCAKVCVLQEGEECEFGEFGGDVCAYGLECMSLTGGHEKTCERVWDTEFDSEVVIPELTDVDLEDLDLSDLAYIDDGDYSLDNDYYIY
jgi:hypothetical protein